MSKTNDWRIDFHWNQNKRHFVIRRMRDRSVAHVELQSMVLSEEDARAFAELVNSRERSDNLPTDPVGKMSENV